MLEVGPDYSIPSQQEAYQRWRDEIDAGRRSEPRPMPIKTIPQHHVPVYLANAGDIAEIFGKAGENGNFVIGFTREQGHAVCLDLEKFVQRSSGVFGATGTGKSFLTRLVLAGMIHYNAAQCWYSTCITVRL
jgi:DNA helicase HerA-like ATPase